MTIAMCYLSPEGVVLGADSTSSGKLDPGGYHYFNHNQKLFEIGEDSTFAALTWGIGSLGPLSYRTLLARLADSFRTAAPGTVEEAAQRWSALFWPEYEAAFGNEIAAFRALMARPGYDPLNAPVPGARDEQEEAELKRLYGDFYVGFCIAGHCEPSREPQAFQVDFNVLMAAAPAPLRLSGSPFWGAPNMILRLMNGWDGDLRRDILTSGKWQGTDVELDAMLKTHGLRVPQLPIRDAVDFVYTCIHNTIKALKFSSLPQICGGPIELAVITSDRRFRWVRHKEWDAAITEGESP